MIDEKDPRQESGKTDSSDDEVIIDLTEEVVVKSQKDDGILELSEDMAGDVQKIAAQDRTSEAEEDEEILDLDEIDPLGPQEEDAVVDLREPVGEERDDIAEDQLIASAIIDSFGDEDENESVTEEFDLTDFDDDQIILDDARDGADENLSDLADDETALNQSEEDVFDLEEEIEIEYEMDDDEDELIVLEDQHAENNPEFARQVLEASGAPDQHDDRPTEFLQLETENQDDFVATDNRPGDDTETAVFAADEEPELVAGDDLPDLEAVSEFDFEEEAVESRLTIEDQEADSGDDIIARAVEHSLGADDRSEQVNRVADPEFALEDEEDEEDVLNLEDSPDDGQEYAVLMDDEPLKFEDDEDLLDLEEGSDLEDDDEVIPLDGFNNLEAEDDEDIIEITEFDQHFPEDAESLLKQSGFLNTSSADEEDFLELIDLEEDRLAEGEQAVTTGDPAENVASVRLDQIFKEDLEADESPIATPDTVFDDDLEDNLLGLQSELQTFTYRPGVYTSFYIHEPKRRLISAAPFRDRVVHHALCNRIEPLFERLFIPDSYANRIGKGTHRALDRCQEFSRRFCYALQCDLRQFFPSVDHQILRRILSSQIDDSQLFWLIDQILESGVGVLSEAYDMVYFPSDDPSNGSGQGLFAANRPRGLPIGNLTSQFWGNVYLNPFDHFIKRELGCCGYLRYVDDFILFADDKRTLWDWKTAIQTRLAQLRLTIHPGAQPRPVAEGIPFLGFVITPRKRRLKRRKGVFYRRKLNSLLTAYGRGEIPLEKVTESVQGWVNHVRYGNTVGLRKSVLSALDVIPPPGPLEMNSPGKRESAP